MIVYKLLCNLGIVEIGITEIRILAFKVGGPCSRVPVVGIRRDDVKRVFEELWTNCKINIMR